MNTYDQLRMRRRSLADRVNGRSVIIPSGQSMARNFPANHFPHRASSHFLYLVGHHFENSYLILTEAGWTLYIERGTEEDALWHGPKETSGDWSERLGMTVGYTDEISWPVGACVLACLHEKTNQKLSDRLGRRIRAGQIADEDLAWASAMVQQRSIHDALAIQELRQAAAATCAAHHAARTAIAPGVSCHEVWASMQYEFTRRGMKSAYQPIITPHGEILHAHSLDAILEDGDLVLIDVGAETTSGWAGDVTRTWPVSPSLSSTQKDIMTVVLAAQHAAIEMVKPGVEYQDIHLHGCVVLAQGLVDLGIMRGDPEELVERDAHALFMPHGMGHLIGLDVHDMEDLGALPGYPGDREPSQRFGLCYLRLNRPLKAGMAITIEPGFYQVPHLLKGSALSKRVGDAVDWNRLSAFSDVRGVRIEDDVLVTEAGAEVLTKDAPPALDKK